MTAMEVLEIVTWIQITLKVLAIIVALTIGFLMSLPALKKAWAAYKNAKTEEERAKAKLEIRNQLKLLVSNVEFEYKNLDSAMKNLGSSAGVFKKEKVLSGLRDFCDKNGYEYDGEELGREIDDVVRLTKEVNSK